MADSKHSRNEDGKVSVESGSEFVFEHICQPCSTENVFEAIGFCVDCQEWLCKKCYKYHRRPTPMRNHKLMDIEQMKTTMPSSIGKDRCTKRCDPHDGKKLKYFCSTHDSVGCSMCIFQKHRGECSVESIPDLAQDIFNKSEFTNLMDRFKDVIGSMKAIDVEVKQQSSQTRRKHSEAVEAIKTFRQELNDALDEIENDLETNCSIHKEAELKKLESINDNCQTVQTQSQVIASQIDALKERGQNCDAFVAMKQAATEIKPQEDKVQEMRGSIRSSSYTFKPNREILKTLRRVGGIGTLTDDELYDERYYSNLKAVRVKDISLGKICRITGFGLLSANKLALIDYTNEVVKVMDTDNDSLISEMKLDGASCSLAIMNDTTFAVTVYGKCKLLILRLLSSGELTEEKSLSVRGNCLGIAFHNNTFTVTFQSPDKIELLDMAGSVLRTLATSEDGSQGILSIPLHVIHSPDKQSIYVSNLTNNTVVCLRLDGTVVAKYHDDELRGPEQAAVDEHGMIFVSTFYSSNVHLITPNCRKVKVILTETDGLKQIQSISYCARRRRLYIGMNDCDKIKVFELK